MPETHRPEPAAPIPAMVRPLIRPVFHADGTVAGRIVYLNGRERFEARPR
jgi:hypothetical protein